MSDSEKRLTLNEKAEWKAEDLGIVVDVDYLASIPHWCNMHPSDHFDNMGGCWGISSGKVENSNGEHCNGCTFRGEAVTA